MDKKKSKTNPYVVQNAIIQNIVCSTIFRREGVDGIEFVTNTSSSCAKKKTPQNHDVKHVLKKNQHSRTNLISYKYN